MLTFKKYGSQFRIPLIVLLNKFRSCLCTFRRKGFMVVVVVGGRFSVRKP